MININLLPKHLRRVKEPAYWRLIAVLFPLLVFGVIGVLQFSVSQTERNKQNEVEQLQVQRDQLQEFVLKQRELQAELANLTVFESLRSQVKDNQILWTQQISSMLETLPAATSSGRPSVSFSSISMQSSPPSSSPERFEGATTNAEISLNGEVVDAAILSEFIRTLENSSLFGVDFQSASLSEETGHYSFNMTLGAIASNGDE